MGVENRFLSAVSRRWCRVSVTNSVWVFLSVIILLVLFMVASSIVVWRTYSDSISELQQITEPPPAGSRWVRLAAEAA